MEEKNINAFEPTSADETEEVDLISQAALDPALQKKYPSIAVGNPNPTTDSELWRCHRCGGGIRTNEDIKKGKMCPRCGSSHVAAAVPSWWETIKLFFHTGKIYLAEKEIPYGGED